MRMPYVAAIVLLSGLAACSWWEGERGSSAQPGYGAATPSTSGAGTSTPGTAAMSESQARQNLSDHGYSNVSNLHRSGDDWLGTATSSSGQAVNFDMNPSGVIVVMP